MDIRKDLDDAKRAVKDSVDNVRDSARETVHRSNADAERDRREIDGDTMTAGDKMRSGLNEAKERTQAEIDKGKREVRENT